MSLEAQKYDESYFLPSGDVYDLPYSDRFGSGNAFTSACVAGDMDAVKSLIADGSALLNSLTNVGFTPLSIAVGTQNLELVKLLLHSKADPNYNHNKSVSVLNYAAQLGNPEIVHALLQCENIKVDGVDGNGRTAIGAAVFAGCQRTVDSLLSAKAPVNVPGSAANTRVAYLAALQGRKDMFIQFLKETNLEEEIKDVMAALCVDVDVSQHSLLNYVLDFVSENKPELVPTMLSSVAVSLGRAAGKDKDYLLRLISLAKKHSINFGDVKIDTATALAGARVRQKKSQAVTAAIVGRKMSVYVFTIVIGWTEGTLTIEEANAVKEDHEEVIEKVKLL